MMKKQQKIYPNLKLIFNEKKIVQSNRKKNNV